MDSLNYTDTDFDDLPPFFLRRDVNGTDRASEAGSGIIIPASNSDMRTAILVTYMLTFIFGSLGNGLVIYIIWRHPEIRRKSVANYYILNLAIADFFFVMTLIFFCYTTFTGNWVFGDFVCKLAYAIRESNKYVSIFTLVALSFDRYLASFYNAGQFRTVTVGKMVCGVIWGCFVVMTTPYWIHCQVVPVGGNRASCRVIVSQTSRITVLKAWGWTQFALGFLLPFLLIVTAYAALGVRLHRLLGAGTKTGVKRPGRAMTRMTLVVTVTFLVTQLPYYIVWLLNVAKMEVIHASPVLSSVAPSANRTGATVAVARAAAVHQHDLTLYIILQAVATILVFVCSCCNPIIYGLLNENYRKLYAGVFCRRCRRQEALESVAGSSDSGTVNGESRNRARQKGVTCVTGVTNTDVIELSRMIE